MRIFPTDGCQWSTSYPSCFNPRKEPLYPYKKGWVGPRAGLDVFKKRSNLLSLPRFEPRAMQINSLKEKVKNKFHPTTGIQGLQGEYRYSSILSLTSALDRGGW
jgi:hypothetical protein